MKEYTKNLGKVVMTPKGAWSIEKEYEILDIVYDSVTDHAYISKQEIPSGVDLSDSRYWMPLNVSGYSDSNVITLNSFNKDGEIQSYTLEEAIKTIKDVGRKSGTILIFYNNNINRLDITTGCWEIWQFNSINVYDWENLNAWVNIYYNYNKFVGWYDAENVLNKEIPNPDVGCYAFVGNIYNEAFVYRCDTKNRWTKTNQKAQHYIKVVFGNNVTIGHNGNWWQDGVDTNIPVSIKGDNGLTPYLRWSINNQIEYSYDNINWHILSNRFNINIKIKDYVSSVSELPNDVELGVVYGVGPVYAENDTEQINPIYNLYVYTSNGWINNGGFNSISAGVVQETGASETEVMSQKAVTENISNVRAEVIYSASGGNEYNFLGDSNKTVWFSCKLSKGSTISVSNIGKGACSIYLYNANKDIIETISESLNVGDSIIDYLIDNENIYYIGGYSAEFYNIKVFDIISSNVLETLGISRKATMSQRAISEISNSINSTLFGVKSEYDKTLTEGSYTDIIFLNKGSYTVKGMSGTTSCIIRFYKGEDLVKQLTTYLAEGSIEIFSLDENIDNIKYYTAGGRIHFSIHSNDANINKRLENLEDWNNLNGDALLKEMFSRYTFGELYDSIKLDKKTIIYNPDTNTYSINNHDWWYVSQTDVTGVNLIAASIILSSNPDVKSQALFLDSDNNVIKALFNRAGHNTREYFKDFIIVPDNASTLLIQSEEYNYRNVYKAIEKTNNNLNIPEYYFNGNYIQNKIKEIEDNKNVSDDTLTFAFVTDIHLTANAKNSPKLINYIANQTDLSFGICGGDIPETDNDSVESMVNVGKEWNKLCKNDCPSIHIYPCRGNHDYLGNVSGITQHATEGQTYNTVMANNTDNRVNGEPSKMYYYFDIPKKKLRIIVLDWYDKGYSYMYISKEQWDWLAKVLITDYRVFIFAHEGSAQGMYVDNENTYFHETLQSILKAAKNKTNVTYTYWVGSHSYQQTYDFAEAGDIIAHIVGHMHKDQYNNDEGLLTIGTTCDALYGEERKIGTITEQAFDIFTVDFKNYTIKSVRIGFGDNRSFSL